MTDAEQDQAAAMLHDRFGGTYLIIENAPSQYFPSTYTIYRNAQALRTIETLADVHQIISDADGLVFLVA